MNFRKMIKTIFSKLKLIPLFIVNVLILILIFFLTYKSFHCSKCILFDHYYLKVIKFTLLQAIVTALLCIVIGLICISSFRKLSNSRIGTYIEDLISIPYHMPSIVGCLAFIMFFGQSGILVNFLSFFNIKYNTFIYGIYGIILCQLFYYLPLVLRTFKEYLEFIPTENEYIAKSLGIRGWRYFKIITWPFIKKEALRLYCMIFMYCVRSFTIVLILGGMPSSTTIEVSLFQAINYDMMLGVAAQLALVQILLNTSVFFLTYTIKSSSQLQKSVKSKIISKGVNIREITVLLFLFFLLAGPLLSMMYNTTDVFLIGKTLFQREFISSLFTSLLIGILTSFLGFIFCFYLVHISYLYYDKNNRLISILIDIAANITLMVSPIVFATILIYVIPSFCSSYVSIILVVSLLNAISYTPILYRVLQMPYLNHKMRYDRLCNSLGIRGYKRWINIDWPLLKVPITYSIATTILLSIGEVRSVLFMNNGQMSNLTLLIYEKMNEYKFKEASIVALLIVVISYAILFIFRKYSKRVEIENIH